MLLRSWPLSPAVRMSDEVSRAMGAHNKPTALPRCHILLRCGMGAPLPHRPLMAGEWFAVV